MSNKVNQFYKSQGPDNSGFTIEELEGMAEEIRLILVGPNGLSLPDYIKRAQRIPLVKLGHRRIYSVKNEPKMEIYFPEEVWTILKKRCDEVKVARFTPDDDKFFEENKGRGSKWISEKLFIVRRNVFRKAQKLGVNVESKFFTYTPEIMNFIRNNVDKGAIWIGDKIGMSSEAIRTKCKREGIKLALLRSNFHIYTKEDDDFIKNNKNKSALWIADQLKLDKESIRDRARRIGVKLPIVVNNKTIKYFTPEEDEFISKNLNEEATWIAKKLNRKVKSVVSRAKHKGWKFSKVIHHYYTPEDDLYIRENANKGVEYLAEIFKVTPNALQKHADRIGVKVHHVREESQQPLPKGRGLLAPSG